MQSSFPHHDAGSANTRGDNGTNSQRSDHAVLQLADHLVACHDAILERWRTAINSDEQLLTSSHLTRVQLLDHVPDFLSVLSDSLRQEAASSTRSEAQNARDEKKIEGAEVENARDHGVHRWQQGYNVWEVTREFTHLQTGVAQEIARYADAHPDFTTHDMARAHTALALLISRGVEESVEQFTQGREAEARSRVQHLEKVLLELSELELVRAQAMRAATHDMRGSLAVVEGAASLMMNVDAPLRADLTGLMQRGLDSLQRMISDFMGLSRLEAGQESLQVAPFDAATLLRDLCENSQPLSHNFGLWLRHNGNETLPVEGDASKVLRIAQNLLLNGLKYTVEGGVQVSWKIINEREWALHVADTGPGLDSGNWSLVGKLQNATEASREIDADSAPSAEQSLQAEQNTPQTTSPASERLHPSEGIGLAIVNRLCDILNARLEVESDSGQGTTFTVVFPRTYDTP